MDPEPFQGCLSHMRCSSSPYSGVTLVMDETVHKLVTRDALHIDALGVFHDSGRMKPLVFIQFAAVAELWPGKLTGVNFRVGDTKFLAILMSKVAIVSATTLRFKSKLQKFGCSLGQYRASFWNLIIQKLLIRLFSPPSVHWSGQAEPQFGLLSLPRLELGPARPPLFPPPLLLLAKSALCPSCLVKGWKDDC